MFGVSKQTTIGLWDDRHEGSLTLILYNHSVGYSCSCGVEGDIIVSID